MTPCHILNMYLEHTAGLIVFETPPIRYEVKTWNENKDVTGKYAEITNC